MRSQLSLLLCLHVADPEGLIFDDNANKIGQKPVKMPLTEASSESTAGGKIPKKVLYIITMINML